MQTYEKIAISVKATHQIMRLPGCFCVFFQDASSGQQAACEPCKISSHCNNVLQ